VKIEVVNVNWTRVDGRWVLTNGMPGVLLSREEADMFAFDDELREVCRAAAQAAGVRGLIPCHTINGPIVGTVEVRP
jgi:hypothetical protein